ncbi:HEAT repeat domain-containing protein [Propionibacteriaceae bacterium G1746]
MTIDTTKIITALNSDDLVDRFHAASTIGMYRVTDAADALVGRLGVETDCQVRERITWATVQVIDQALPGVIESLTSEDDATRTQAAHVLSKAGRPEFADALVAIVNDPNPRVAIKGYRAAASTGNTAMIPVLVARLGEGDKLQLDLLTSALLVFGDDAVPALTEALASEDAAVRAHAAEVLGFMGDAADPALDALAAASSDTDQTVRIVATTALGQLSEVADEALAKAAQSADAHVAHAATRLQQRRKAAQQA